MLKAIFLKLIKVYQICFRPTLPSSCRFSPSCSEYAKEALEKYGLCKGGQKAIARLARCHPFSRRAGLDPLE